MMVNLIATVGLTLVFQLLPAIGASARAGDARASTTQRLTAVPEDTAEAERVRIWLPAERSSKCRVRIEIIDDSNRVIRHFLDQLLGRGYYNFYWDKRDDSGEFVPSGSYRYVVNNCGKYRRGRLQAEFKKWERTSILYLLGDKGSARVGFELEDDSALVSMSVINRRGIVVDRPFTDSLMNRGKYEYQWIPPKSGFAGKFVLRLTVGDYTHKANIQYIRKKPRD